MSDKDFKKTDFVIHGQWMQQNVKVATMYEHIPTGDIYYEDCKTVRDRNLPIYPWGDK